MEAMQATDELGFEPIDRPPDVNQVRTQGVRRDTVDGLVDERVDSILQTVSRLRDRERFHGPHCTKHLFANARTMRSRIRL